MDAFVHRVVGVEPLAVLLIAVEDKRLADKALALQLKHILHGRRIAEGEAHLGLQPLGLGEALGAPDIAIVVADRLLHQTVFACLQHIEDHLLVIGSVTTSITSMSVRASIFS